VDQGDVERKETAEAGTERDDDERAVEGEQRIDVAEQDEARTEDDHTGADHPLWPEAVD